MSQEKVDAYLAKKANRKAEVEKERKKKARNRLIAKLVSWGIAVVLVAALAVTGVNAFKSYKASLPDYAAEGMVVPDYTDILSVDEEAEETEEETQAQ